MVLRKGFRLQALTSTSYKEATLRFPDPNSTRFWND